MYRLYIKSPPLAVPTISLTSVRLSQDIQQRTVVNSSFVVDVVDCTYTFFDVTTAIAIMQLSVVVKSTKCTLPVCQSGYSYCSRTSQRLAADIQVPKDFLKQDI